MIKSLIGLDYLESQIDHDLEMLQYPPLNWVKMRANSDGLPINDVVIIGGGMCGLVAHFALLRAGINNIRSFDLQKAGYEGPWINYARMETLRSPKNLAGPSLGMPNLTFQAWFEAQWGREGWDELDKIPTRIWMDYLVWYRKVLNLNIENEKEVVDIKPTDYGFEMAVESNGKLEQIYARKIILATGREGMAEPRVPKALKPFLGETCQHSSEDIDFKSMAGKDVAVVGISASAIDNAASALEAGAAKVYMIVRSPTVPRINKMKSTGYPGFMHGFPGLPLSDRLELLSFVFNYRVAPPRNSVLRVWKHQNVELCLDSEIKGAKWDGAKVKINTNQRTFLTDNIILGTGFKINTLAPSYLKNFSDKVRTFRDGIQNSDKNYLDEFLDVPDLGIGFELKEKIIGEAPYLKDLYEFTFAATVSHGNVSGDIPAVSEGAERLVRSIAANLFIEDYPAYLTDLHEYEVPELFGDEIPENNRWSPKV